VRRTSTSGTPSTPSKTWMGANCASTWPTTSTTAGRRYVRVCVCVGILICQCPKKLLFTLVSPITHTTQHHNTTLHHHNATLYHHNTTLYPIHSHPAWLRVAQGEVLPRAVASPAREPRQLHRRGRRGDVLGVSGEDEQLSGRVITRVTTHTHTSTHALAFHMSFSHTAFCRCASQLTRSTAPRRKGRHYHVDTIKKDHFMT
jgi:hypothetical protein